jgi:hypothetical protein
MQYHLDEVFRMFMTVDQSGGNGVVFQRKASPMELSARKRGTGLEKGFQSTLADKLYSRKEGGNSCSASISAL